MFKKIILIVIVLAIISGGTVFALDKLSTKQKIEDSKRIVQEKEEYKRLEEQASEESKNKNTESDRTVTEIINPANPNEIKREWTGRDGLTYKLDALKNDNGTYTGSIKGLNMYDGFIEYNFTFKELSQSGFDHLFDK